MIKYICTAVFVREFIHLHKHKMGDGDEGQDEDDDEDEEYIDMHEFQ